MKFIVKNIKHSQEKGICGINCPVDCQGEIVCDLWLLVCGKL